MGIQKCKNEHSKTCNEELKLFTLDCGDSIVVELYCSKCGKRYGAALYNLSEIDEINLDKYKD
jgi:hypothetical protein